MVCDEELEGGTCDEVLGILSFFCLELSGSESNSSFIVSLDVNTPVRSVRHQDSFEYKIRSPGQPMSCNRQAVGAQMYLMCGTRPDLAFSVGFLSKSLENPFEEDIVRVKRVFRYILST
uniref:Uncharacterized protein n=1 Tax=Megaselia scalaris TaxID=36166 RepID=T1GH29_MEGSC